MRVSQWMSQPAITCKSTDSVNDAARLMWEHDCGAIPVVDGEDKVVGIVTDRDICMAAYTQGERLWAIPVTTAMATLVVCCHADDSVEAAQAVMSEKQIHRLPVVDGDGRPLGVLSFTDVARETARSRNVGGAAQREFVTTAGAICRSRSSEVQPVRPATMVATADL
jgi:CBS domain-containing protein